MRRIICIIIIIITIVIAPIACIASEEGEGILFLNIPWLSSVSTVYDVIAVKLTKDTPSGNFAISEWNAPSYGNNKVLVEDIPIFSLSYEGRDYYKVADFNVSQISLKFVPNAPNGVYSKTNFDDYAFIEATYRFDEDSEHNYSYIYNRLKDKLSSLYGKPTDKYEEYDSNSSYSNSTRGYVWMNSGNHSFLKLRWEIKSTKFSKKEYVYLSYAYADEEYIQTKQKLSAEGESTFDVDAMDGL